MEEGHQVTLMVQDTRDLAFDLDDVWRLYGIRMPFDIRLLKKSKMFPFAAVKQAGRLQTRLVYTRNLYVAAIASMRRFPAVLELHDFIKLGRHVAVLKFLKFTNRCAKFVAITKALKTDLVRAYPALFTKNNILVAPDGVDIKAFRNISESSRHELRKRLGVKQDRNFIAGYAGNLYRGKGYEIIKELAPRLSDVLFLVAGGPEETVAIEREWIRQRGIPNIKLVGYLPGDDIPCFLSLCDALLLPNQEKVQPYGGSGDIGKYTSPLKLFEYLASGKPILASDLPVLREALNETNAVLVPHNNVEAWVQGLQRMVRGGVVINEICHKGQMDAAGYDWQERVRHILKYTCRG